MKLNHDDPVKKS